MTQNTLKFQTKTPRRASLLNVGILFFILSFGMVISLLIICCETILVWHKNNGKMSQVEIIEEK